MRYLLRLAVLLVAAGAVFVPQGAAAQQEVCAFAIDSATNGYGDYAEYEIIYAEWGVPTYGGSGNQVIVGTGGPDHLEGGSGNDVLCGFEDDDVLVGGSGNDFLDGDWGFNELYGGSGNDSLFHGQINDGGSGSNVIEPSPYPVNFTFDAVAPPQSPCTVKGTFDRLPSDWPVAVEVNENGVISIKEGHSDSSGTYELEFLVPHGQYLEITKLTYYDPAIEQERVVGDLAAYLGCG